MAKNAYSEEKSKLNNDQGDSREGRAKAKEAAAGEQDTTKDESEAAPSGEAGNRHFYIAVASLVALIILIILVPGLVDKGDREKSYDELVQDALKGVESDDTRVYNGFVFVKDGNLWFTEVSNPRSNELYRFGVRFTPDEVENVTVVGNINDSFRTGRILMTFDPYDTELGYVSLAAAELSLSLSRAMGIEISAACMSEHPDCEGREIVSCNTTSLPVIEIVNSNKEMLYMSGNCMRIQGRELGLLRVADRVLFRAYGIMDH